MQNILNITLCGDYLTEHISKNLKEIWGCTDKPYSKTDFVAETKENQANILAYDNSKKELGEDVSLREIDSNTGIKKDTSRKKF